MTTGASLQARSPLCMGDLLNGIEFHTHPHLRRLVSVGEKRPTLSSTKTPRPDGGADGPRRALSLAPLASCCSPLCDALDPARRSKRHRRFRSIFLHQQRVGTVRWQTMDWPDMLPQLRHVQEGE